MTRALQALFALALALPTACKEKRPERVAASYSSVTKPSEQPAAPPRSRPPDKLVVGIESIPVEESYEERAATSITEANLQAKVSELEKELGL